MLEKIKEKMVSGKMVSGTFLMYTVVMSRAPRVDIGGEIYHVINRANSRENGVRYLFGENGVRENGVRYLFVSNI